MPEVTEDEAYFKGWDRGALIFLLETRRQELEDLQARLSAAEERERHWIGKYNEACVVIDTVRGELLTESSMRTMQGDGERRERERLQSRLTAAEAVVEAVQRAHTEHLKTGNYISLGIAAQDAIRRYEEGK